MLSGPTWKTGRTAATAAVRLARPPAATGSRARVNRDSDCHLHFCLRAAQTLRMLKLCKHSDVESADESGLSFGP